MATPRDLITWRLPGTRQHVDSLGPDNMSTPWDPTTWRLPGTRQHVDSPYPITSTGSGLFLSLEYGARYQDKESQTDLLEYDSNPLRTRVVILLGHDPETQPPI